MKQYLEIGKIVSVFGLKGEIKVQPWCDSPELLCEFDTLYWKSGTPVKVERARVQKNIVVMKLEECDTVEAAQKLRGRVLYMDRNDVELEEGARLNAVVRGISRKKRKELLEKMPVSCHAAIYQRDGYKTVVFDLDEDQ